ncbi:MULTISPECIES: hypothetical protein [Sporichthya]|uniref:Uncharacterized protein n=1 Tax=Sporichthya brevicatena TaxID=171442 RepID=A0ABN1GL07_9ACTN|nr:hypothetical protein [Sporichthya polymorpha]
MAQNQIRIERKTLAKKGKGTSAQQSRRDPSSLDLRSPSGRKLPY